MRMKIFEVAGHYIHLFQWKAYISHQLIQICHYVIRHTNCKTENNIGAKFKSHHILVLFHRGSLCPHLLPHPLLPGHIHYTFKHLNCCYMLAVLINILIAAADPLMFCAAEDPIMLQTTYHLFLSMVTIKWNVP